MNVYVRTYVVSTLANPEVIPNVSASWTSVYFRQRIREILLSRVKLFRVRKKQRGSAIGVTAGVGVAKERAFSLFVLIRL